MGQHQLSSAEKLFWGDCYLPGYHNAFNNARGIQASLPYYHDFGAVATLVTNGICAAQAIAGAANASINGSLAVSGVVTHPTPRATQAVSTNAGDTTQTLTITGTDQFTRTQVERISLSGTTVVNGKKAFKTITQIAVSAAMTGNLTVGTNDILGLPIRMDQKSQIVPFDSGAVVGTATLVVADATDPATLTTGDTRGTVDFAAASDGTLRFAAWLMPNPPLSKEAVFGVAPFAG